MDYSGKQEAVEQIGGYMGEAMSIVLADYRGVDVPTMTEMRHDFTKAGCQFRVLKNTLVKLAIKGSDKEPMSALLKGPTAVIWSEDSPSAAAKVAVKWAKEIKEFDVKGGFFEGEVLDTAGITTLSKMPGKKELQATLLMTFLAAPTDFVKQLAAGPQQFVYLVDARRRQLESQ